VCRFRSLLKTRPAFARPSACSAPGSATAQRLPRSCATSEFLARLDALLSDVKRLNQPVLPELERASLRGLAHYAVKKWSEILRAFDKPAWRDASLHL